MWESWDGGGSARVQPANGKIFEYEANLNRKWTERGSIGKMDTSVLARKYKK